MCNNHQVILGTGAGQIIRVVANDISIFGRATKGVIIFKTSKGEKVVSAEVVSDSADNSELSQKDVV